MAEQGWALDGVGFGYYHFTRCEPGEYTVRSETRNVSSDYVSFLEETGAEYIGHVFQWAYFRKKTELGQFDLYSDLDSRIAHLKRINGVLYAAAFVNLFLGIVNRKGLGWINLLCFALLTYAIGRIHGKEETLEKDRQLRE